jgi:enoyl-CoA hydratase/carnithine racemase
MFGQPAEGEQKDDVAGDRQREERVIKVEDDVCTERERDGRNGERLRIRSHEIGDARSDDGTGERADDAPDAAASSAFTVGLGKAAFYTQIDPDQPKAYAYAKEVMSMNALDADAREGIAAFLERRSPQWKR